MGVLRIELLGNPAVMYDGAPVLLPRKPYELLCLLVTARVRPVDESWLVHHLWRGDPPTTAPTALRVHLSKLRSALEPARSGVPSSRIARTVGGWRLRADVAELDVLSFESTAAEAAAALGSGDADRGLALSRLALSTWQGMPFPGVDLEPVSVETARLIGLHERTHHLFRECALRAGRGAEILAELERAYADDPEDEDLLDLLARARYQTSGQQAALAVLREHRRRVRAAGLTPAPTLNSLEGRILRHELMTPAPSGSIAVAEGEPAELLGRQDLLETLAARCRRSRIVLLIGGAGVGKSSVLQHLALPGYRSVRITCSARGAPLSAVRSLLATSLVPPRDQDGWRRLRRLVHDASTGPTPSSVVLLAEDLVSDLFRANRLLVTVDDVDQLDSVSAAVIAAGLESAPQSKLVVARRASQSPLLARTFDGGGEESGRLEPDAVLVVPPLETSAAARLLARLRAGGGHDRLDDSTALDVAAGNPWLLESLTTSDPGESAADRLLAGLSPRGRQAALLLAMLKSPLDLRAAAALLGQAPVEELLVTTIAVLAGEQCRLRHDLLGEVMLQAASAEVRRAIAASGFRKATEQGWEALELATLAAEAGSELTPAERRRWAVEAGWAALRAGDPSRAAGYFELAGDTADGSAETGLGRLGQARRLEEMGDLAGARRWYVRAITALQAAGSDTEVRDALLSYVGVFAPESSEAPVVGSVTEWLLARQRLPPAELLSVLDARAAAAAETGADVHTANAALVDAARQVLTPLGALYGLHGRWRQGHHKGASPLAQVPLTTASVELAEQVGDEPLLVRALRNQVDSLLAAGQPEASQAALTRLAEVARRARIPQALWWVEVMTASTAIRQDDLELGVELARCAHDRWRHLPAGQRAEILQLQLLVVAYQSGRLGDVADGLAALTFQSPDPTTSLVPQAALAVDAQLGLGVSPARLAAMVQAVRAAPASWLLPATTYLLGRAAVMLQCPDPWLEATLATCAGTWALLGTGAATLGPVDAVLAGLAALRGDEDAADRLAAGALVLSTRMGSTAWARDTEALRYSSAHEQAPHAKTQGAPDDRRTDSAEDQPSLLQRDQALRAGHPAR